MANINSMFGFGGVRFKYTYGSTNQYSLIAYFSGGFSDIKYNQLYLERENVLFQNVSKLLGWKTEVSTELINIRPTDYLEFANLMQILNFTLIYPDGEMTIWPEYNENILNPEVYNLKLENMRLDSTFNPQQVANIEAGQTLNLTFIGNNLTNSIPLTFSQTDVYEWIDQDGDNIVDDNGDELIFV